MKILNLTQHNITKDQQEYGIFDLPKKYRNKLYKILTFDNLPDEDEILNRTYEITDLLCEYFGLEIEDFGSQANKLNTTFKENKIDGVMIGSALWLMKPLIEELIFYITPYFAFSKREIVEDVKEDGSVEKKVIFKFEGLVEAI